MKKRLRILIPLIAIAVLIISYRIYTKKAQNRNTVKVSGTIEVTQARLGFRIPGKLEKRMVREGDTVIKGQVLARLDAKDQKVALDRAEANYAYTESVVQELSAGTRPQDIERAKAELDRTLAASRSAEVQLAQAKSDFERFKALYKNAGISQRDYELYKTKYETAKNQYQEAKSRVTNVRQALSLSKEGPRKEALDQARARMSEAKAALEQARLNLTYTELQAPSDGIVLTTAAEEGEYLNPGSAVLITGDIGHPWVRAYINEKDLGRVRLTDKARVISDSFKNKEFPGEVSFISSQAEFTPKTVQTFEERVKLMFRIKISLENPDKILKPGMPVDAIIQCPNTQGNQP